LHLLAFLGYEFIVKVTQGVAQLPIALPNIDELLEQDLAEQHHHRPGRAHHVDQQSQRVAHQHTRHAQGDHVPGDHGLLGHGGVPLERVLHETHQTGTSDHDLSLGSAKSVVEEHHEGEDHDLDEAPAHSTCLGQHNHDEKDDHAEDVCLACFTHAIVDAEALLGGEHGVSDGLRGAPEALVFLGEAVLVVGTFTV